MSPGFFYTILMVGSEIAWDKARGWWMPAFSQLMGMATGQSLSGVQSIMVGGTTWSSWMGRWAASLHPDSKGSHITMGKMRLRAELCLCMWNGDISGPTWQRDHGLVSYESRHEPDRTCLGSNVKLIRDMDRHPSNLAELCQAARQPWRAFRARRVRTLVESMLRPGVGVTKPNFLRSVIFHIFRYCQNKR